jgi:hypothetical protein
MSDLNKRNPAAHGGSINPKLIPALPNLTVPAGGPTPEKGRRSLAPRRDWMGGARRYLQPAPFKPEVFA